MNAANSSEQPRRRRGRRPGGRPAGLGLRRVTGAVGWELVHPRCARERELDLEEVESMLEAGETEVARDELRWLLDGCDACLRAHRLLGELALEERDFSLARGHFGYAYELGRAAARGTGQPVQLLYAQAANQALLESAKGLAFCLVQLGRPAMAADVVRQLLAWDPSDPLGAGGLLNEPRGTPPPDSPPSDPQPLDSQPQDSQPQDS